MEERIARLELVWRIRAGGGGKIERRYLDFVVDGQPLGDLLQVGDSIGCLGWNEPKHEADTGQRLLLKQTSPLETGRRMLYICAECGDIGCGAFTAQIEKTAAHFVWRDFGYENDYDPSELDLTKYAAFGPCLFDKAAYWKIFDTGIVISPSIG